MDKIGIKIGDSIYADLESVFDIRFTILEEFFDSLRYKGLSPIEMIKKDPVMYYGRLTYGLPTIPSSYFKYVYEKCIFDNKVFKSLVKKSKLTNILNMVNAEIVLLESKKLGDEFKQVTLTINTFPLELTEIEINTLKFIISTATILKMDDIEIVNDNHASIIRDLKSNKYDVMFMYRGLDWLNTNILINKFHNPETKLYVPAILYDSNVDIDKPDQIEMIFNSYKEIMMPFIDLTFIPQEIFSLPLNMLKKK